MRRREFLGVFGGAIAAWPRMAFAQPGDRVRRIGVLFTQNSSDLEANARIAAFREALQELGWIEGRNLLIEIRWAAGDADVRRKMSAELAALTPDVLLAGGSGAAAALLQATRTVPIVFVYVSDPVGAGFVESLARPGGSATGFALFEYSMAAKILELLKEIAPGTTRAAVLRDAAISAGIGQFGAIQTAGLALGVEVRPVDVRDANEIERAIDAFAQPSNSGLIVTGSGLALVHRDLIVARAARHRLPAVYAGRVFVAGGGLVSYGPDRISQYRYAAGYVDRILKGAKPSELPVEQPTKFELVINLKTAKALGLTLPATLLARADEVIE